MADLDLHCLQKKSMVAKRYAIRIHSFTQCNNDKFCDKVICNEIKLTSAKFLPTYCTTMLQINMYGTTHLITWEIFLEFGITRILLNMH